MKPGGFWSKLNWRHILINYVASWCIIHSFEVLSFLYDLKLFNSYLMPGYFC